MSIIDLHSEVTAKALPRAVTVPTVAPAPTFSAWKFATSPVRGVGEAVAQVGASFSEIVAGYGDVMGRIESGQSLQDRQPDMQSDFGDALRDRGREFRPDPLTAHAAEQVLYGFARGASKVVAGSLVAGPGGAIAAGFEEGISAADDLAREGVDFPTRTKAAAVQGAGLALAALPLVGKTIPQTAALYVAGGPGGFVAQQALTREILREGGYDKLAEQYDPFDPVGLAVASLIPAPFTVWGFRQNSRLAAAARSLKDLPLSAARGEAPREPAAPFVVDPIPSVRTAVAQAIDAYQREVEDAARVSFLVEQRRKANPGRADDPRAADRHEAALTKAENQISLGEPVQVADVAPRGAGLAPDVAPVRGQKVPRSVDDRLDALADELLQLENNRGTGSVSGESSLERVLRVVTAGSRDSEGLLAALRWAIESGRTDIADAVVMRMERGAEQAEAATPGLSQESPKYEAALAALKATAQQARQDANDARAIYPDAPRQHKVNEESSSAKEPNSDSPTDRLADFGSKLEASATALQKAAGPDAPPIVSRLIGDPPPKRAERAEPGEVAAPKAPPKSEAEAGTPGASAETGAASSRIAQIEAEFPDLMVRMDGDSEALPLSEFLARAKAEADELAADAPLMQIAAECAILRGN